MPGGVAREVAHEVLEVRPGVDQQEHAQLLHRLGELGQRLAAELGHLREPELGAGRPQPEGGVLASASSG